jgi:hypothetical protein
MVSLAPHAFADAAEYIEWYRSLWETRLDSLEQYLSEGSNNG